MKEETRRKILVRSEWFILPYLLVFCLLTLPNVADHWGLPGVIVFVAQSIVIILELFTAFHIVLLLNDVDLSGMEDGFYSFFIAAAVIGMAAIPLSFFWGWILFALAFVLLLYHVGISIYLFMSRQTVEQAPEEKLQEITQVERTE